MDRRRPLALLAALLLLLCLSAPAWAQDDTEAPGDEPAAVEAQGTDNGDGSDGVEASGQSSPSSEYSGPSFDRASNGEDDVNCDDFEFREDAEEFFEAGGGADGPDEDGLDEDPGSDDGMPCETLPSRDDDSGGSDEDDGATPTGGVDSGFGPVGPDETGSDVSALLLGGVLFTAVLLGVGLARRQA